ncbi:MAG: hypothetical protein ACE15E_10430 [Acidobacteriota bacterium]
MKPARVANRRNTRLVAGAVLFAAVVLSLLSYYVLTNPDIPFLLSEKGATWVKLKRAIYVETWRHEVERVTFRTRFTVNKSVAAPILVVRALKDSEVRLDGRLAAPFRGILREWKKSRSINLAPFLSLGQHELQITVQNKQGPALLLAHCEALGVFTSREWTASYDGVQWVSVQSAADAESPEVAGQFETTLQAFASLAPFQISLFAAVFVSALGLASGSRYSQALTSVLLRPSRVRWFVLLGWAALALNNAPRLSLTHGFDVPDHYEYIAYVAQTGRIPLASEGWQMFQSPLYYLISAIPFWLLSQFFTLRTVALGLRAIPLACGILQVEVCYRAMRHVFPEKKDLQILGTLVGGLMPMNLYMSQYAGNEPLAAILTSVLLLVCFTLLARDQAPIPRRFPAVFGMTWGLAILTKVSALLLAAPALGCFVYAAARRGWRRRNLAVALLAMAGFPVLISGWYHLRNWITFGKPFIGGWDSVRGLAWWQDPGYRTVSQLIRFGETLIRPVFSGTQGFWDSIYSTLWADGFLSSRTALEYCPPWNYRFMFSGILFALVPTIAIILGILGAFRKATTPTTRVCRFAAVCLAVYFLAVIFAYINVPIYSAAKATYTLGLLPCYAALCAAGLELMMRGRFSRALAVTLMVCWAVNSYLAFFVVR